MEESNKRKRPRTESDAHSETNTDELKHSWTCKAVKCQYDFCEKFKDQIAIVKGCKNSCAELFRLISQHTKNCFEADCQICKFTVPCHVCSQHVEIGNSWFCKKCPTFEICSTCYQKDVMFVHCHQLSTHMEPWNEAQLKLTNLMEALTCSTQCQSLDSEHASCREVKWLFNHKGNCTVGPRDGCNLCNRVWKVLKMHALSCEETECVVSSCRKLKEHFRVTALGSEEDLTRKDSHDEPRKESTDERQRERERSLMLRQRRSL